MPKAGNTFTCKQFARIKIMQACCDRESETRAEKEGKRACRSMHRKEWILARY